MDPYRKVNSGQRLKVPAPAWNRLMDLAGAQDGFMSGPGSPLPMHLTLPAKNDSGALIPRFAILEITGITPAIDAGSYEEGESQFLSQPCVKVNSPSATPKRIVIAAEPITTGSFGRVIVCGVTQCKIDVKSASHRFAKAIEGEIGSLESSWSGPVEILWSEGVGDEKHALVRIGGEPETFRLARFAGTWAKGATAEVGLCDEDGLPVVPTVVFDVVNYTVDVSTPNASSYGHLGANRLGSVWVLMWFECAVAVVAP